MWEGYCLSGNIEKGFTVLRDMVATGKHEPDEILCLPPTLS